MKKIRPQDLQILVLISGVMFMAQTASAGITIVHEESSLEQVSQEQKLSEEPSRAVAIDNHGLRSGTENILSLDIIVPQSCAQISSSGGPMISITTCTGPQCPGVGARTAGPYTKVLPGSITRGITSSRNSYNKVLTEIENMKEKAEEVLNWLQCKDESFENNCCPDDDFSCVIKEEPSETGRVYSECSAEITPPKIVTLTHSSSVSASPDDLKGACESARMFCYRDLYYQADKEFEEYLRACEIGGCGPSLINSYQESECSIVQDKDQSNITARLDCVGSFTAKCVNYTSTTFSGEPTIDTTLTCTGKRTCRVVEERTIE